MSSTSFAHQNWFSGQEVAVGNMLKIQIVGLIIFFCNNSCSEWGTGQNDPLLNCYSDVLQLAVKLPEPETGAMQQGWALRSFPPCGAHCSLLAGMLLAAALETS